MKRLSAVWWLHVAGVAASLGAQPEGSLAAARAGAAADEAPAVAPDDLIETWGEVAADEADVSQAELGEAERAAFRRGLEAGLRGSVSAEWRRLAPDVERFALARRSRYWRALEDGNLAASRRLFAGLAATAGVKKTPGGFSCQVLREGGGPTPKSGDTVVVHYVGRFVNGADFDEYGPGEVILVAHRVRPALFEGMQAVGVGGKLRLYVPPTVPGAAESRPGVPRGAATIYDVEILGVHPTAAGDLANSRLPAAPEPEPEPPSGASPERISEAWGGLTAGKLGLAARSLGESERAVFLRGLMRAVTASRPIAIAAATRGSVREFVAERKHAAQQAIRRRRAADAEAFFARLATNPAVRAQADGLRYEMLDPGHGRAPRRGEIAIVDYTGRLLDGTIFDQTYNEPLHVEVGSVIEGLNEGLQKIGRGGRIRLYVPPSLGYGEEDKSGVVTRIPGGSLLIYELELHGMESSPGTVEK